MSWSIHQGDALKVLQMMPEKSVNCCVTSPPYWRLRHYGVEGQIGDEPTIEEYLEKLVAVFREVRRVLRDDGVSWLNMGDGYVSDAWGGGGIVENGHWGYGKLKLKDLIGMPWRLAFALQANGWYLRSDTIWHKPNPLPESAKDRPTKAHDYLFLLSKRRRYYFDIDAIKEPVTGNAHPRGDGVNPKAKRDAERAFNRRRRVMPEPRQNPYCSSSVAGMVEMRNPRSIWTIPTQSRHEDHFASFPDELARRCILSGCPPGGTVLDPFVGRGTSVIVALRNQRNGIGIDLSPKYCEMARQNIIKDAPLLNKEAEVAPPSPAPLADVLPREKGETI